MFRDGLVSVSFRQSTAEEMIGLCRKNGIKCIEWGRAVSHALSTMLDTMA